MRGELVAVELTLRGFEGVSVKSFRARSAVAIAEVGCWTCGICRPLWPEDGKTARCWSWPWAEDDDVGDCCGGSWPRRQLMTSFARTDCFDCLRPRSVRRRGWLIPTPELKIGRIRVCRMLSSAVYIEEENSKKGWAERLG